MKKWKAFVARGFPGPAMERLKAEFDVDVNPGWLAPPREEFMERVKDADALLVYSDPIDAELMDAAPNLKLVVDHWGRKPVDPEAAARRGITFYQMPNSYPWIVDGVADIIWGMMIACGRRFQEGGDFIRDGRWSHSEQSNHLLLGQGLSGRTVGILGAGRIGLATAMRAPGFGVRLIYHDVTRSKEMEALDARYVDKDTFFETADYITVSISDIDENRHYIGRKQFRQMKKTAFLINTARGRMIDEPALVEALETGEIAGAALEVFEFEPNVTEALKHMRSVIVLPHIGGALYRERAHNFDLMVDACIEFKHNWEAGGKP